MLVLPFFCYDETIVFVSHDDHSHLLGAMGVAQTTLRPAGTARIGDEFVDVVTEGTFIKAGTAIIVHKVSGARVVVRAVKEL